MIRTSTIVAALCCPVSVVSAQERRPLRVLLLHDMEGLSGEDDWRMTTITYPALYAQGRQLLMDDVNAVIAGLFDGGATAVDVTDGHGSGNHEPDIILDQLDERAQMIFRDRPFDPYSDLVEPDRYEAVVNVGMHAKPGSRGFLSHTYTGGVEPYINGHMVTEPELIAYSWGRVGVPVVLVTGDDRLEADLAEPMPWIEYVVVKHAKSASEVDLLPVDQVQAEMRAAAKRAPTTARRDASDDVGRIRDGAAVRARPPGSLTILEGVPGVNYADDGVTFTAPDFITAYDGIIALIRVASRGRSELVNETLNRLPFGRQALQAIGETRTRRWLDYESGLWSPPPPIPPELQQDTRYFGAR